STLGCGPLHCVDLVRRPQRTQLCVGALQAGLLALTAQRVLFDELIAWATVQAELQAAIVLREVQGVATHAPDDDGSADITGLDLYLPAHPRAAALNNGQAAALTTTASAILKGQRQIFCGDHFFPECWLTQDGFVTASNLHVSSNTSPALALLVLIQ
uniref:Uncharacterized protein n=1 Tax=Sparus aurata TaxID=8175 RepID=A0A671UK46_SPAAU